MTILAHSLSTLSCLSDGSRDIIGQAGTNQIFLLQKNLFSYKLSYYKSVLSLKLEVGVNYNRK